MNRAAQKYKGEQDCGEQSSNNVKRKLKQGGGEAIIANTSKGKEQQTDAFGSTSLSEHTNVLGGINPTSLSEHTCPWWDYPHQPVSMCPRWTTPPACLSIHVLGWTTPTSM